MKNIVFDCGQVLVHFDPAYMVGLYVSDQKDAKLLEEVLFDRLYWDRLDAGTITDEELMEAAKKRIPEALWEVAEKIYYNWIYNLPEMEGMRELIEHIKGTYGVSTYLLSNISHYFADHAHELPILGLMDHSVYSSRCGFVKPDPGIYRYLCETYGLKPEETMFIDDRADNIEGARKAGLYGYVFDGDTAKLRAHLDEILKK
ncbi:MAG: HAD family phosphatase [Clostridiales bacterium]|nr:HAD family phosphatase [Clostridiales bacterium]